MHSLPSCCIADSTTRSGVHGAAENCKALTFGVSFHARNPQLAADGFINSVALMALPCLPRDDVSPFDIQFDWTEVERKERPLRRSGETPQPSFCFETCLKLFYWTFLVYTHDQDENVRLPHTPCKPACLPDQK